MENLEYFLEKVEDDGCFIEFINEPCEALQFVAVNQNGHAIQDIKDPSEAVKLVAVRQNGMALQHIKEPCEAAIALHKSLYPGIKR